jgi:hypothetical protein
MKHDLKKAKNLQLILAAFQSDYLLALDHGSKSAIAVGYCHQ